MIADLLCVEKGRFADRLAQEAAFGKEAVNDSVRNDYGYSSLSIAFSN